MKKYLAITLLILAGCSAPQKPASSFVLQPGTKIITRGYDDAWEMRKAFRSQTDYWRTGSVVEIREALLLSKPQP